MVNASIPALAVRFIVMSIIDECGIFNRLSSVGNTDFDLVTLRNCRLNPSMAFMGSISVRTSCGYLKQMDNFGRLLPAIAQYQDIIHSISH